MSMQEKHTEVMQAIEAYHANVTPLAVVTDIDDNLTEDEKLVLDLKTLWPIVKSIFVLVRPFIKLFKGSKATIIIDRFIKGIDVIIPAE